MIQQKSILAGEAQPAQEQTACLQGRLNIIL